MKPWMWLALGGAALWYFKGKNAAAASGVPDLLSNAPMVTPDLLSVLSTQPGAPLPSPVPQLNGWHGWRRYRG